MRVPFHRVSIAPGVGEAVERVLESGWLTTGEECLKLEQEIAGQLGVNYGQVVTVSSCTAALELACRVLCDREDIVAVPAMTFGATALAPLHAGQRVVVVDVLNESLNLNPERIPTYADCVIPVHYGGAPADLSEICNGERIVIEDAAHAWGAEFNGEKIGRCLYGSKQTDAACFSLYATKPVQCGEGGFVVFRELEKADEARALRQHGMSCVASEMGLGGRYEIISPGIKANLSDLLAAIARAGLSEAENDRRIRKALAVDYDRSLHKWVRVPIRDERSSNHLYPIRVAPMHRDEVARELDEAGIQTSLHYRSLAYHRGIAWHPHVEIHQTPVANAAGEEIISLPLFPSMTPEEHEYVVESVQNAVGNLLAVAK